jgi:hypothetical protein
MRGTGPSLHSIGQITGLIIHLNEKALVVEGTLGNTEKIALAGPEFCFLLYIAEERERGESAWLTAGGTAVRHRHTLKQPQFYDSIRDCFRGRARATLEDLVISKWSTMINGKVKPYIDHRASLLINTPRAKLFNETSLSYCLNFGIKPKAIRFVGKRVHFSPAV